MTGDARLDSNFRTSDWYRKTHALAAKAHEGQRDKQGQPYVGHLERVVDNLVRCWPDATMPQVQIALLHDAIEDGKVGTTQLGEVANDHVLSAVLLLTRLRETPYFDYIRKIADSASIDAIRVKLADNEDSMDWNRWHLDFERMLYHRYHHANIILVEALLLAEEKAVRHRANFGGTRRAPDLRALSSP